MDMALDRNAFERQRQSFEAELDIEGLEGKFRGVFIRAPAITKVWGDCKILAKFDRYVVMAQQGSLLAVAFHPELANDTRIHKMLLSMV